MSIKNIEGNDSHHGFARATHSGNDVHFHCHKHSMQGAHYHVEIVYKKH
jgi:hypothetical protein